ncbi:agamous-like MADS-box protein AGL61 [Vicia villosa]|uniref:agamous-like MADS-box protein AGL61 n=1 Tax=Vicia villosa TaxID=3911 RepID=UPI00273B9804|nr:agamous-like MADS-box protein AGL61 [Vicia villosa]
MNTINQRKKTMGRKKIEIKKVEKEANKQVTFSKRRSGLFKKACELCILCDVHLDIIVFSPADKIFRCGCSQPSTDAVLKSYIRGTTEFEDQQLMGDSLIYEEYNKEYEEALKVLQMEKKKLADIENLARVSKRGAWWNDSIDDMNGEELEYFMMSIFELKKNLLKKNMNIS